MASLKSTARKIVTRAADQGPERFRVEVTDPPTIKRGGDDQVTSIKFKGKAAFKGEVVIEARGEVAKSYWSVTPGMRLTVAATEKGKGEWLAESLDVLPAVTR